jgi:ankyrin repeat protein
LKETWNDQTLRNVAEFSCSITLAAYLLEHGADINGRPSKTQKTALHRAAGNTSAEGAEMIRFLLLNGANPEVGQDTYEKPSSALVVKRVREEQGAKGIHRWLGKTWDELVEETNRIRNDKEAGKELMSRIGEGKETAFSG